MTRDLVGQVNLRNTYRVYTNGSAYFVVGENPRGQSYESKISRDAVTYLKDRLRGRRVDAEQAAKILAPKAEGFKLPYTYGDKLRYSAQHVLIVLVALGDATVVKEGRSYMYSVKRSSFDGDRR